MDFTLYTTKLTTIKITNRKLHVKNQKSKKMRNFKIISPSTTYSFTSSCIIKLSHQITYAECLLSEFIKV